MTDTLEQAIAQLAARVADRAAGGEIPPRLVLVDPTFPDGTDPPTWEALARVPADARLTEHPELLLGGTGEQQARVARIAVLIAAPALALLVLEGWRLGRWVPTDDPDARRLLLGEIAPSQLPAAKRGEVLIILGEAPTGERLQRAWEVGHRADGTRALEPWAIAAFETRFTPLFMVDDALRSIPLRGVPPAEARVLARRAIAQFLASDDTAGGTTSRYAAAQKRARRKGVARARRAN